MVRDHEDVYRKRQDLLDLEIQLLTAGTSNNRTVLQREDDLHQARDERLQAQVNNALASIALDVTRGTFLERIGHEVEPIERPAQETPANRKSR
jgi:outer membrane protein TolC